MKKCGIAMIGVGDISGIYLQNIMELFHELELIGVCDLVQTKAQAAQTKYPALKIYPTMHDAFQDPAVDIVLNLTRPYEHFDVSKAALEAGKHVYTEKPLAATFEEGRILAELAKAKGLQIGGAPDTFLGAGIQTCRKLIDDGFIGEPIGAAAFMICRGHESWHPDPAFYYQHGGGPMMDMGPYYVTALLNLLGRVNGVTARVKTSFAERTITSQPQFGTVVPVHTPTYMTGILDFENGAIGSLFTTFDVHYESQARFEIYGSEGTMIVPDPNTFGGPIKVLRAEEGRYMEMPLLFDYKENSRGLGLADMAKSISSGRAARTSADSQLHVLEIMTAYERSSELAARVELTTPFERQEPMKKAVLQGVLDA